MHDPNDLTRRRFLGWMTAGGVAAMLPAHGWASDGSAPRGADGRPMNVLFIAVDDLRPQLHCYGRQQMSTPNIDRLASRGTLFQRTYCQQAVCGPSRASLITGARPDTTRVHSLLGDFRDAMPDIATLPQLFKNRGYRTEGYGKLHHSQRVADEPSWDVIQQWYTSDFQIEENKTAEPGRPEGGPPTEIADAPDDAYGDGVLANIGIERLRALKDQPFFLGIGFRKPHLPFCCPRKYWDLYNPDDIDLADNPFAPEDAPHQAMHHWGELRQYAGIPAEGPLSDEQARHLIHGYYACTSFMDAQFGKVLDELDALGLSDNTIVCLWADHGFHLGDHGLWCKHSNFENATHVPLIISAPHMPAGQQTNALTEYVDVYPTLCELANLPRPDHLEGTSLVPLMQDLTRPWKSAAFSQYPRGGGIMGYSMRTDRYRFTQWRQRNDDSILAVELYDYETDPQGNVNIAGRAENRELVDQLAQQLAAGWREATPTGA